jgi:hypothetical protein
MTTSLDTIRETALAATGSMRILMILDRSGSMQPRQSDVIGGFNTFVTTCRDGGLTDCQITYVQFDDVVEPVFTMDLADVPALTERLYQPRGGTALLDAVGATVSAVASKPGDRYIVITFTDGHENASREWTKEGVATLLREREALGNWTFGFIGADIDAWSEARDMGYATGSTMSHSGADISNAMRASARAASAMKFAGMRHSNAFGKTARLAMDDPALSDDELARSLKDDAEAPSPNPAETR